MWSFHDSQFMNMCLFHSNFTYQCNVGGGGLRSLGRCLPLRTKSQRRSGETRGGRVTQKMEICGDTFYGWSLTVIKVRIISQMIFYGCMKGWLHSLIAIIPENFWCKHSLFIFGWLVRVVTCQRKVVSKNPYVIFEVSVMRSLLSLPYKERHMIKKIANTLT